MQSTFRAGVAGLLVLAAAAPVASAADVTVRAESFERTVLPETTVSNMGPDALKNEMSCPEGQTGRTAAGALERATNGDWDGQSFSFGLTVERIRDTDLGGFPSPTFWNFVVDNVSQQVGICDVQPQPGQEILFYEACADEQTACFTGGVLGLSAPSTAVAGRTFTVRVDSFDDSEATPAPEPAAGATVVGGGATAVTSDDGTAQITLMQTGRVSLVASKNRKVRDAMVVTVQAAPVYEVPTPDPTPGDTTAPVSRIKSPRGGKKFNRGPRKLRARVREAAGIASVRLGLFRRVGPRCSAFDAGTERFKRVRCGAKPRFVVGTDDRVSFLLPRRLGPGKYSFDVVATDKAGNRERVERGRNRVVFRVR